MNGDRAAELLDPELASAMDPSPKRAFDNGGLAVLRAAAQRDLRADGTRVVTSLPVHVSEAQRDRRLLIVRPAGPSAAARPGVLWLHGGGYVTGLPEHGQDLLEELAHELGAVVVSPDYRLAPEHPYPAALHDCHDTLTWMHDAAAELGIDTGRIAIGGASAGGGLAAALALLNRDRAALPVSHQVLIYPMLDDRTVTRPADPWTGHYVWTREQNAFGWRSLLGAKAAPGDSDIDPYAAPARARDLTGLPPAYVAVGTLDLFLDESIDYAHRLIRVGVPTELHVEPGAVHGYLGMTGTRLSRKLRAAIIENLRDPASRSPDAGLP